MYVNTFSKLPVVIPQTVAIMAITLTVQTLINTGEMASSRVFDELSSFFSENNFIFGSPFKDDTKS